jgi:hypothetical protein
MFQLKDGKQGITKEVLAEEMEKSGLELFKGVKTRIISITLVVMALHVSNDIETDFKDQGFVRYGNGDKLNGSYNLKDIWVLTDF